MMLKYFRMLGQQLTTAHTFWGLRGLQNPYPKYYTFFSLICLPPFINHVWGQIRLIFFFKEIKTLVRMH